MIDSSYTAAARPAGTVMDLLPLKAAGGDMTDRFDHILQSARKAASQEGQNSADAANGSGTSGNTGGASQGQGAAANGEASASEEDDGEDETGAVGKKNSAKHGDDDNNNDGNVDLSQANVAVSASAGQPAVQQRVAGKGNGENKNADGADKVQAADVEQVQTPGGQAHGRLGAAARAPVKSTGAGQAVVDPSEAKQADGKEVAAPAAAAGKRSGIVTKGSVLKDVTPVDASKDVKPAKTLAGQGKDEEKTPGDATDAEGAFGTAQSADGARQNQDAKPGKGDAGEGDSAGDQKQGPANPGSQAAPMLSPADVSAVEVAAAGGASGTKGMEAEGAKSNGNNPVGAVMNAGSGPEDVKGITSANSAGKAQESQQSSSDQTLDQIVLGLRGKMDAKNGKAEIQLNPPNLGSLKVSVSLENGSLTAQFNSDNPAVRDLLSSNFDKLRSVLQGQGIPVDKLAVKGDATGTQTGSAVSAAPATRLPDSAAHDGRSAGNNGYSGQQQRQTDSQGGGNGGQKFATIWQQANAPVDLVA